MYVHVRACMQALDYNSTLCQLNLSWNRLGSHSGVLLGRALEYNHTLQLLNLAYNAIGDEGAMAIGQALKVSAVTLLCAAVTSLHCVCVEDVLHISGVCAACTQLKCRYIVHIL
jgi:Ran GTPase-activating protein (RanGAP) involved in mRNA processing and transport